ncbi:MAG: RNA polymerase sigma-70 factor [Prevotella sp.]|nr:RNA polymerase sigma-70 factor [Prevotella sp.]MBR1464351.1 RNA polymerase sigma-70 factor [Prevotella sp.]
METEAPLFLTREERLSWNEDSFRMLYKMYYKALTMYALNFVEDKDVAEDIVQDMFFSILDKKTTFANKNTLHVYLYTGVRNRSLNYKKHREVEKRNLMMITDAGEDVTDDEVYAREDIYRQLFEAIDCLPARQREVFLLAMEGKKNQEVAERLGISIFTVKVQRQRAMQTLRKRLTDKQWLLLLNFFVMG